MMAISPRQSALKRLFDLTMVLMAAPLVLPLLLLVALMVRLKLGGPFLFRQLRPGLYGEPFTLLKFRSMNNLRDDQGRLLPDKERLGRFGRLLRNTSLDELPTLWNVVTGDMSLVGPRPLLMEYLQRYTPQQMRRHEVKPGVTGWAQVHGRNALSWEDKFSYDLWYVDHWSLRLDIKILIRTVTTVLKRQGVAQEGHATMPLFTGDKKDDHDRV